MLELLDIERQQMDDRFDMLDYDRLRYIEAGALGSISLVSTEYHRRIKETHDLSTKQVSKFFKGKVKSSKYEPQDTTTAIKHGYHGTRCPQCQSLRYEEHTEATGSIEHKIKPIIWFRCYACSHVERPVLE